MIHPTALVSFQPVQSKGLRRLTHTQPESKVGSGTIVGPYAVIFAGAEIGADCLIGTGAVIREGVRIGNGCVIGTYTEVSYDTVIGNDTKIMGHCSITGKMVIGNNCFIGMGVRTSNDRHLTTDDYEYHVERIRGPAIMDHAFIGTGANLLAEITIGRHARVAAGALVTKDVPDHGLAMGSPAMVTVL